MASKKDNVVIGVFRDRLNAERAFDELLGLGYRESEINMLMSDATRAKYYSSGDREHEGKHRSGSMATEGMGVGGAVGTAVGATIAAIAAIGTSLVIPGLGLIVAGPLAAGLAGAGAGAVSGGLIGALVGYGIPEQNAEAYTEVLREGGVVLGVTPRSREDASKIKQIFEDHDGENIYYS